MAVEGLAVDAGALQNGLDVGRGEAPLRDQARERFVDPLALGVEPGGIGPRSAQARRHSSPRA
jgi:hypothetical protein